SHKKEEKKQGGREGRQRCFPPWPAFPFCDFLCFLWLLLFLAALSHRRKARLRGRVDRAPPVRLQRRHLRQRPRPALLGIGYFQPPRTLPAPARRQYTHPPLLALERLQVRVVRGRLQTRDITVLQRRGVLPHGETRQFVAVEAHRQPAGAGGVVQQRQRPPPRVAEEVVSVDLFGVPDGRPLVGLERGDALGRRGRQRGHLPHRRHNAAPRFQERRADVAVIQHLQFRRLGGAILDHVMHHQPVGARHRRVGRRQPQVTEEQRRLL